MDISDTRRYGALDDCSDDVEKIVRVFRWRLVFRVRLLICQIFVSFLSDAVHRLSDRRSHRGCRGYRSAPLPLGLKYQTNLLILRA